MNYIIIIAVFFMASCHTPTVSATKGEAVGSTQIANPASVKCIEDGHRLEIRTSESGGQYGVCIDTQGNECEEWKYFRGECTLLKSDSDQKQKRNH